MLAFELDTSQLQSAAISRYASGIDHWLETGPNPLLRYPQSGPFDRRAGYSELPEILPRLEKRGFTVTAQARVSVGFERALDDGLFPIYREKTQAGLEILDREGRTIYAYAYPQRTLPDFVSVPPLLVSSLVYIENRELLDGDRPYRNPAVEWDRLAMMGLRLGRRSLGDDRVVQGASTLATQIEKFRHSPGGLTQTPAEKFRQMASASVRAYRDGRTTLRARQRIVVDYLNGLPLAALPNHGEIHGLVDGLWLWYGIDGAELALLREPQAVDQLPRAAYVYRAALSLILATRRPAFYLASAGGQEELERLCDAYAILLERERVISAPFARAVRELRLVRRHGGLPVELADLSEQKAVNAIRADLLSLLGAASLYRLDRLDLTVSTAVDGGIQGSLAREFRSLRDAERRAAAGLAGENLLPADGALPIVYSILLCEATAEGNLVLVQTDSFAGPRDVSRHTKLELGSTAKLRTLLSYLEIVEALHEQLAGASDEVRAAYLGQFSDPLTQWIGQLLERQPALSLEEALAAALSRRYSASPGERFFTAGGLHTFSNFDRTFDGGTPTVQEAFSQSVNLVFIRLMRDVVRYHEARVPFSRNLIEDVRHPLRVTYLSRFAHQEGQQFLRRFHGKHFGRTPAESIDLLVAGKSSSPLRVGRIYVAVAPEPTAADFGSFLRERVGESPSEEALEALFRRVLAERLPLSDLAHLADVHPLELWLAQYLVRHPGATLPESVAAADAALEEAYRWLFRTRRKELQDLRIRTVLEAEAFAAIHAGWQRLGYPFTFLVPSYATAIGSSGDSPEALAELMGILVNDGIRRPTSHVTGLKFAQGTPFETHLRKEQRGASRVLSAAIAHATKTALADVIANGTGRRLRGVFVAPDGTPLAVGAKTGTGDNRHVIVDRRGGRVGSYARNRTATVAFFVGNHFGVVTAHVEGPQAGDFTFTSALPAQILRHVAPLLEPLVQRGESSGASGSSHHSF